RIRYPCRGLRPVAAPGPTRVSVITRHPSITGGGATGSGQGAVGLSEPLLDELLLGDLAIAEALGEPEPRSLDGAEAFGQRRHGLGDLVGHLLLEGDHLLVRPVGVHPRTRGLRDRHAT